MAGMKMPRLSEAIPEAKKLVDQGELRAALELVSVSMSREDEITDAIKLGQLHMAMRESSKEKMQKILDKIDTSGIPDAADS